VRIGIVTVTFNSEKVLRPFLRCCLAQRHADCRLLVVDNASSDGTRQIISEFNERDFDVILNDANVGFAAASNQGIRHFLRLGFERILLLNNDTEFGPTLVADLDRLLAAHQGRVITPRITFHDRPDLNWYCGGRLVLLRGVTGFHDRYRMPNRPEACEVRAVEYAPACCLMVDRSVFEEIGVFDERYFVYWEDVDFCMRLKRARVPILYAPGIVVAHKASSLTGGATSDFSIFQYHHNQVYFVRKHFGPLMLAYTVPVMIIKGLLRVALRGDSWQQFRKRLQAMMAGLRSVVTARRGAGAVLD